MDTLLFAIIISSMIVTSYGEGHCVMYGLVDESHNLRYDGPPKKLDDPVAIDKFKELCSPLLPKNYTDGDPIMTCCGPDQVESLYSQSSLIFKLIDCPSCTQNINIFSCSLVCGPKQSEFIQPSINSTNSSIVDSVLYAVSESFTAGLFNSCKDVKVQNSLTSFLSFICQTVTGKCTSSDLIKTFASLSPFKINVSIVGQKDVLLKNITNPMDEETCNCNSSYIFATKSISRCSCVDCLSSCPPIPDIPDSKVILILNYFTVWEFSILLIFIGINLLLVVLFTIAKVSKKCLKRRRYQGSSHIGENDEWGNEYSDDSQNGSHDEGFPLMSDIVHEDSIIRNSALLGRPLRIWGRIVATNRVIFIIVPLLILLILCCGIIYHKEVTSDPIDLWSPQTSATRKQKEYIDGTYGPFYRTQQVVISSPDGNYSTYTFGDLKINLGPAVQKEIIETLFKIQEDLFKLNVSYVSSSTGSSVDKYVTLQDICLKPLNPESDECAFFSITQYFQNSREILDITSIQGYEWPYHLALCSKSIGSSFDPNYENVTCLSKFHAPINPQLVFGGYDKDDFTNSTSLILTFVVQNSLDPEYKVKALAWEKAFIEYLKNFSSPHIRLSFSSESSVEMELNRQTYADISTVAISYIVMFIYVSFSLGKLPLKDIRLYFVSHRIYVGFSGVILVLLSILGAVGFFCYLKFQITLIILEVLPFLLLAVGVDNIFVLVLEYQRVSSLSDSSDNVVEDIAISLGNVGGGMIVSVLCQVVTFSSCSFSDIPAVRSFSLFAALALALNFFLQMTCFVAIFSLDASREKSGRIICLPCIKVETDRLYRDSFIKKIMKVLSWIVKNRISSILVILTFFMGWFGSLYVLLSIPIGLDQTLPLPSDSYLLSYFQDVFSQLRSGAPVYFVVDSGFKYEIPSERAKICHSDNCLNTSLTSQVFNNILISNYSKLAVAPDSWVDTYKRWLTPTKQNPCCSYKFEVNPNNVNDRRKVFCPSIKGPENCTTCISWPIPAEWEPTPEDFGEYLPWFLEDIPNNVCPSGGKPAYGSNVILNPVYYSSNRTANDSPVLTSRFLSYHVPLSSFEDFFLAYKRTLNLTEKISVDISQHVFPYSIFYVFYEAYLSIWKQASVLFGISAGTILIVNLVLFKFDLRISLLVTFTIFAIDLVDAGFMFLLGINLNPVSLVNLTMLIGINVEFVCHVARAFQDSVCETSSSAARDAMINSGTSVLSGIALTKILGITVLAFSKSNLFKIYYFKMYSIAIISGTLHGLIFLPVALKYVASKKGRVGYRPFVQEIGDEN